MVRITSQSRFRLDIVADLQVFREIQARQFKLKSSFIRKVRVRYLFGIKYSFIISINELFELILFNYVIASARQIKHFLTRDRFR